MPTFCQLFYQMSANEASSTTDQNVHFSLFSLSKTSETSLLVIFEFKIVTQGYSFSIFLQFFPFRENRGKKLKKSKVARGQIFSGLERAPGRDMSAHGVFGGAK